MKNNIVSDLTEIYDNQAKKYFQTRQKAWNDKTLFREFIQEYIDFHNLKKIRILEFGIWWGRFTKDILSYIKEKNPKLKLEYIWIDISKNLIKLAKTDFPDWKFVVEDIQKYMSNTKQEEFDMVVWIASFQHIFGEKERSSLMKKFYRSLKYDWILLMQNWSFSEWFVKKYTKEIMIASWNFIKTFGKFRWNDIFIYFNWEEKARYYHIFTLWELNKLAKIAWFNIKKLCFVGNRWNVDEKLKNAKNSLMILQKKVI